MLRIRIRSGHHQCFNFTRIHHTRWTSPCSVANPMRRLQTIVRSPQPPSRRHGVRGLVTMIEFPLQTQRLIAGSHLSSTRLLRRPSLRSPATLLSVPVVVRKLRTTEPRRAVPAIVWVILRPLTWIFSVLIGRFTRKMYKNLPAEQQKKIRLRIFKVYGAAFVIISSALGLVYSLNQEETPITGRRRFRTIDDITFETLADMEFEQHKEMFKSKLLDAIHPTVKRVGHVAFRIINANTDIPMIHDKKWSVTVIESPIPNAFVLPNGQIVVFSGIVKLCANDDQLGVVLAHEMAHAILQHGAERMSYMGILNLAMASLIAGLWAFFPTDLLSAASTYIMDTVKDIIFELPYNRKLEQEADEVGLRLAAKACVDVREAVCLWAKFEKMEELKLKEVGLDKQKAELLEFLSTHPNNEKRKEFLQSQMDAAIRLRESCGCPRLPLLDPRLQMDLHHAKVRHFLYADRERHTLVLPRPEKSSPGSGH